MQQMKRNRKYVATWKYRVKIYERQLNINYCDKRIDTKKAYKLLLYVVLKSENRHYARFLTTSGTRQLIVRPRNIRHEY